MSDTFASARWSADLMYQLASAGGPVATFTVVVMAGTRPSREREEKGFVARPIYYGMLLFAQAGAGQLVGSKLDQRSRHLG